VRAAVPEHDVSLLESLLAPHYELVGGNITAKGDNAQRLTRRRKETHQQKETKC
jgi:hypothetical protein